MADQHLEVIDSTVPKTHEWLGASAEASHLSKAFGPPLNLSSVAGHVLVKLAVAAIPVVIIVALGVATIAAFVGGYLAALG
jgi:hypothetical protein